MSTKGLDINANTFLLAIIMALSSWTLKKVTDIGEKQASMEVQIRSLERVVYAVKQTE